MHALHKILVYIPDTLCDTKTMRQEQQADAIRSYAEVETEEFLGSVFDCRKTKIAEGRTETYPENVLFAADDVERFTEELRQVMDTQKVLVEHHVSKVKESLGTDIEKIAAEVFSMQAPYRSGSSQEMALLYLRNLANFLFGEYQFDSRFYNLAEHTARVYPETIQIVKNEPENWAMALFNYHN